ncbi:MAG TPA: bifunctional 4-hydroxy-2-oxoglutarate aldolase/2-dehydro-3-deoxy-phosphogluconate aldolase [Bacteroidota bacterium]|nr:bifunctional 4-hydroxy-2-oxoglutarate aldolase/2-dehydro-3-deoxy-phosphogluconate aldolase [Bacteroidota bacterium]
MKKNETLDAMLAGGVVAVIRMKDAERLSRVVMAIREGGVNCIEITMTVPGAVEIIAGMVKTLPPDVIVGAGTVTDKGTAIDVLTAGAKFVVSPVFRPDVVSVTRAAGVVSVPGCYTPTEILSAWEAGADIVKVFPATTLGPKYFKDIAGPFPHIRLMPTGGVTIDNVGEWIKAGAVAVGIGGDLLDKKAIEEGRYEVLTERAARMVKNFRDARG